MKKTFWYVVALALLVQYCAPKQDAAYFTQLGIDKLLYTVEDPATEGQYPTDAVTYLEKAISMDSTYALAYTYLPYAYFMKRIIENVDLDGQIAREKSRWAVKKAQELAPDHSMTLLAAGWVKKIYDNDMSGGIELLRRHSHKRREMLIGEVEVKDVFSTVLEIHHARIVWLGQDCELHPSRARGRNTA